MSAPAKLRVVGRLARAKPEELERLLTAGPRRALSVLRLRVTEEGVVEVVEAGVVEVVEE